MRLVRLYAECCSQVPVDSGEFSIGNVRCWPYRSALPQAHNAEQHADERDLLDCHSACHLRSCGTGAAESLFLGAGTRTHQHREIDRVRHCLVTRGTGVKVVT